MPTQYPIKCAQFELPANQCPHNCDESESRISITTIQNVQANQCRAHHRKERKHLSFGSQRGCPKKITATSQRRDFVRVSSSAAKPPSKVKNCSGSANIWRAIQNTFARGCGTSRTKMHIVVSATRQSNQLRKSKKYSASAAVMVMTAA